MKLERTKYIVAISQTSVENRLLSLLPEDDFKALAPALEMLDLPAKKILHEPDEPVEHAYFPTAGICSVIAENNEGVRSETGVIGKEGFIGIPIVLFPAAPRPRLWCRWMAVGSASARMTCRRR